MLFLPVVSLVLSCSFNHFSHLRLSNPKEINIWENLSRKIHVSGWCSTSSPGCVLFATFRVSLEVIVTTSNYFVSWFTTFRGRKQTTYKGILIFGFAEDAWKKFFFNLPNGVFFHGALLEKKHLKKHIQVEVIHLHPVLLKILHHLG